MEMTKIHRSDTNILKPKYTKLKHVIFPGLLYIFISMLIAAMSQTMMPYDLLLLKLFKSKKNHCRVELQCGKAEFLCSFVAYRINQFGILELGFMQDWR